MNEQKNAVRGRAMRKTVWFCWLFTLIYTVLVIAVDIYAYKTLVHVLWVDKRFFLSGLVVQLLTLLGGAVILLWGEFNYLGAGRDENTAYEKDLFYIKGFYAFICIFAFAYCLHVSVNLAYGGYGMYTNDGLPYGFFPALLLECGGLVLMSSLKSEGVMLNSADAEGGKRYYKGVLCNILKFGGLCFGFTVFAFFVYFMLSRESFSIAFIGVPIAGFAIWLVLSAEYFLLSLMERLSEKAKAKGRLSLTTLITFMTCTFLSVCYFGLTVYLNLFAEINSGETAAFYSYIGLFLGQGILLLTSLFVMYFCSEIAPMNNKILNRSGEALDILHISQIVVGYFSLTFTSVVMAKSFSIDWHVQFRNIMLYVDFAVEAVFAVVAVLFIIPAVKELGSRLLIPKIPTAAVCAVAGVRILIVFLSVCLQHSIFGILGLTLSAVLYVFFAVYVIRWYKNIKFEI